MRRCAKAALRLHLRCSGSTAPSYATVLEIFLNIPIKLPRHRNRINTWKIAVTTNPLGGPTLTWVHYSELSFKERCSTQVGSLGVIHLKKSKLVLVSKWEECQPILVSLVILYPTISRNGQFSHPSLINWSKVLRRPHRLQARMPRMDKGTLASANSATCGGTPSSSSSSSW